MKKALLCCLFFTSGLNAFSQILLYKSQADWENNKAEEYTEYNYPATPSNVNKYMFIKKGDEKFKLEKNDYWAIAEPEKNRVYRMYQWGGSNSSRTDHCLLIYSGEKFYIYILGSAVYNEKTKNMEYSFEEIFCSTGFSGKLYRARDFDKELPQFKDDLKGCGPLELKCYFDAAGPVRETEKE